MFVFADRNFFTCKIKHFLITWSSFESTCNHMRIKSSAILDSREIDGDWHLLLMWKQWRRSIAVDCRIVYVQAAQRWAVTNDVDCWKSDHSGSAFHFSTSLEYLLTFSFSKYGKKKESTVFTNFFPYLYFLILWFQ